MNLEVMRKVACVIYVILTLTSCSLVNVKEGTKEIDTKDNAALDGGERQVIESGVGGEDPCMSTTYDNITLGRCLNLSMESVDSELSNVLAELHQNFWDKESRERLRRSQLIWYKYIKADCEFQKPNHGGD